MFALADLVDRAKGAVDSAGDAIKDTCEKSAKGGKGKKKETDEKKSDTGSSGPARNLDGSIDFKKQRLRPLEERVDDLKKSGKIDDPDNQLEKIIEEIKKAKKSKNRGHEIGEIGNLEALERKVFQEGKTVRPLKESKVKDETMPDNLDLDDSDFFEAKTRDTKLNNRYIKDMIRDASKQMEKSPLVNESMKQGGFSRSVEIQFIEEGANPDLELVKKQIRSALTPERGKYIDRVRVYDEGELLVEFVRGPDGKTKQVFPLP